MAYLKLDCALATSYKPSCDNQQEDLGDLGNCLFTTDHSLTLKQLFVMGVEGSKIYNIGYIAKITLRLLTEGP